VSTVDLARKQVGVGILFFDPADRVLLVDPVHEHYWDIPGGSVEADESPYEAAIREIAENLGLSVVPGRLLAVDWAPPERNRTEAVQLVYDGGLLTANGIQLPPDELRGWAWSDPAEADKRLPPPLARRVSAARRARGDNVTAYLEDGTLVA
jgi:8-oxo-dGTP diphosphatase